MSKRLGMGWVLAVVGLVATGGLRAATPGGLAVVDLAAIIDSHPDTAAAETLLKQQTEEYQAEQDRMIKEFRTLREAFRAAAEEASSPALSEAARAEKRSALEATRETLMEREQDIQETASRRQKQLTETSGRMRGRIVEQVERIVAAHAKEQGLQLVLNATGAGRNGLPLVMYGDGAIDITSTIIARLAAERSPSGAGVEGAPVAPGGGNEN